MLADVPTNLRKTLYDFFSSNIELKVDLVCQYQTILRESWHCALCRAFTPSQ